MHSSLWKCSGCYQVHPEDLAWKPEAKPGQRRTQAANMSYRAVNGYNGDVMTTPPPSGQPVSRSSSFNIRSSQYIAHQEKNWVEIQKNTFTNWCNEQLRNSGIVITDLATAFSDGITLVHLVEAVSMKKVPRWNRNPKLYAQIMENTTAALKVLENDGIQLVNIGKIWKLYYFLISMKNF